MTNQTFVLGDVRVAFRPHKPWDEDFIFNAWLKSHREIGDWPPRLSSRRYFDNHKLVVAKILREDSCIVACNSAEPTQIFGFVAYGKNCLHWLTVKHLYRRQGLGLALLATSGLKAPIICSHWTLTASKIRASGWPIAYDPFAIEEKEEKHAATTKGRPVSSVHPGGQDRAETEIPLERL